MRTTLKLFAFSLSLIHAMPCICGSISNGHRELLQTTVPFSVLTRSGGKNCTFHSATSASDVKISNGFMLSLIATGLPLAAVDKNLAHFWSNESLNRFVNGPMYEINALLNSASPTTRLE